MVLAGLIRRGGPTGLAEGPVNDSGVDAIAAWSIRTSSEA